MHARGSRLARRHEIRKKVMRNRHDSGDWPPSVGDLDGLTRGSSVDDLRSVLLECADTDGVGHVRQCSTFSHLIVLLADEQPLLLEGAETCLHPAQ